MIKLLSNGIKLIDGSFWRAWAAVLGWVPLHNLPEKKMTSAQRADLLNEVEQAGGFGFIVTRQIKGNMFQKLIDGATYSPWGHAQILIGANIGEKTRKKYPGLMIPKPSPRWLSRSKCHPFPTVEGIDAVSYKTEIVESRATVEVGNLHTTLNDNTQAIIFINPKWTEAQKIKMARESYSWVGEPYDIFEIAHHGFPGLPNPENLKVCSSLVAKILSVGDPGLTEWCNQYKINIEKFTPRDLFAYGASTDCMPYAFRCDYTESLNRAYRP